jgi:hypothetical protein
MLGCKEDNMYKDFHHIEYTMRKLHNIKEDTIVEDMGRNIPRIYATLEDQ